ncbi:MAG: hypothetical protein JW727_02900 [Candidatus Aenigmarchaeota archaeon]|nr:hypothetical protein [Candidatus Aenigmarchaeota archaeon]
MVDFGRPELGFRFHHAVEILNDAIRNEPALRKFREKNFIVKDETILNHDHQLNEMCKVLGYSYLPHNANKVVSEIWNIYGAVFEFVDHFERDGYSKAGGPSDVLWKTDSVNVLSELRQRLAGEGITEQHLTAALSGFGGHGGGGGGGAAPAGSNPAEGAAHEAKNAAEKAEEAAEKVEEEEKKLELDEKKIKEEEEELKKTFDSIEKHKLHNLEQKEIKEIESGGKRSFRRFSLGTVRLMSKIHFDAFLTLGGMLFGGYLTVGGYFVMGLPVFIASALIGWRNGYFRNIVNSFLRPAGDFAMSSIPLSILVFIAGWYFVRFFTMAANIEMFDTFQFSLIAFANTLFLIYLWVGATPKDTLPVMLPRKEPAPSGSGGGTPASASPADKRGAEEKTEDGVNGGSEGGSKEGGPPVVRRLGGTSKSVGSDAYLDQQDISPEERALREQEIENKMQREMRDFNNEQEKRTEQKMESAFAGLEMMEKQAEEEKKLEEERLKKEREAFREEKEMVDKTVSEARRAQRSPNSGW